MDSIFTYNNYKNILNKMKKIGEILTFSSANIDTKSGFILRHDIDFNVEKAYIMSNMEAEINVKSTYFVLTTSDIYNINCKKNRQMLIDMNKNKFEIGLHFDPTIYGDISLEQMQIKMKNEVNIIENIIGNRVESISLHNPSVHNRYPNFKGYKNAYSKEFFNPDLYISDSCKDFRGKNIYTFIQKGENNLIQVLFHPIHFSKKEESYITCFNGIINDKIKVLDQYKNINKTYKKELGDEVLLKYFIEKKSVDGKKI
ncbi:hypothetical protein [Clostridium weizhouense]|uniref:ChbG/HpnK family deacetylase n=1 Tax=Clostridium weizhouense TaxID=2859781 RepID=A0ABS7AIS9_9CLOT|nr:hypothetical protein [Clostridium weizhouense]MBW6408569.1 hypothetical protein [Clostridium weizhouense]